MKHLLLLTALFSLTIAYNIEPAIVGGRMAEPHSFPFMAAVHWVTNFPAFASRLVCGGALLSRRWVLTAAHCTTELPSYVRLDVILGMHNERVEEPARIRVTVDRKSSVVHPEWVPGKVGPDDLAILYLSTEVNFSDNIKPINLPIKNTIPTGMATAIGWGSLSTAGIGTSGILRQADLPLITNPICRGQLITLGMEDRLLSETNICTGPIANRGICGGDNGGPLVQRKNGNFVLLGIASWMLHPCASPDAPSGIYKRVDAYVDWIKLKTGIRQ